MSDTLMTVIGIGLAAILFLFPVMSMSERVDDTAELVVQAATTEFVDMTTTTGVLTLEEYDKFISTLASTGNSYDIEMQIYHIDENPGVKVTQADTTKVGENLYYNEYTTQIEKRLDKDGKIALKEGDMFLAIAKNTNKTIAEMLRGFFYRISGDDTYQIEGRHVGTAKVSGSSR